LPNTLARGTSPQRAVSRELRLRGEAGRLGIAMPEAYGGQGGNAIEYLIVVEALFRYSQS
jgi:alkylation response protein AidB-like acyl-CoA dehydrogenase